MSRPLSTVALPVLVIFSAAQAVLGACPCLASDGGALDHYRVNGDLMYEGYVYPSNYGIGCTAHDTNLAPYCLDASSDKPEFCVESFCYVDKDNCDLPLKYLSGFFPLSGLYYSYQQCGNTGTFNAWFNNNTDNTNHTLADLADVVEDYVLSIRNNLQSDQSEFKSITSACSNDAACGCTNCAINTDWGESVDFTTAVIVPNPVVPVTDATTCLASVARSYFLKVAAAEYQDATKVGYLYAGTQVDGAFMQWPGIEW